MAAGDEPYHLVWEDEEHLAFLSIFPNTPGVTVVIPKEHYSSYVFEVPGEVMVKVMTAAKKVAKMLDDVFDDSARTGVVYEGFGGDHLHAKLFPLHGTADPNGWRQYSSKIDDYYEKYPGYISSHNSSRTIDSELVELAEKIRIGKKID